MSQKSGSLESTRFLDVWFNIHVLYQYIYIRYIICTYHVQFNVAKLFTEFTFTIMKCQVKHGQGNLEYVHVVSPPKKNTAPHRTPPLMAKCHATRHKNQLLNASKKNLILCTNEYAELHILFALLTFDESESM